MNLHGISVDPQVNAQLDLIEAEFKAAVLTAIDRLNDVLAGKPEDTQVIHDHLADLHTIASEIDRNTEKRSRLGDGCGW
jgi:hypothetical protein